jgi:hypothetical protein
MRERIDPGQPLPLYYQVAEAIRYRVATGELRPGAKLPSLRRAAVVWGVNMHTVRRAYLHLEEQGIVRLRRKSSPVVLGVGGVGGSGVAAAGPVAAPVLVGRLAGVGGATGTGGDTLHEYVAWVAREAWERWGVPAEELAERLVSLAAASGGGDPVVHVMECSATQALDLAGQLAARYRVRALPWSLDQEGEPPAGPLVATYFHYNEIRSRWPHRFWEVRFAATHPDPALRTRVAVRSVPARSGGPVEVLVCERDAAMARNIVADLIRILPAAEYVLEPALEEPARLLSGATGPVLFAPRIWGEMDEECRLHGLALQVRYVFQDRDLEAMAAASGWTGRA